MFKLDVVQDLANKYKKTPAQVLVRYAIDRGLSVIPKSVKAERIKENFNVFDFKLTEEDLRRFEVYNTGISTIRDQIHSFFGFHPLA